MNVSIINALWAIMVGERLDLEDPNLIKVVKSVDRLLHEASPVSPVVAVLPFPAMVKLKETDSVIRFGKILKVFLFLKLYQPKY